MMPSRTLLAAALFAALVMAPFASGASAAVPPETDAVPVVFGGDGIDLTQPGLKGWTYGEVRNFVVVLDAPPVLDVVDAIKQNKGMSTSAKVDTQVVRALHRNVLNRQAEVKAKMETLGVKAYGGLQTTANTVNVMGTRSQIMRVAALPEVKSLFYEPPFEIAIEDSRPHLGVDQVAQELGYEGEGTTIAIIDTGVDYYHVALGGSGDAAARAADDGMVVEDGTFPTERVTGGYDVIGAYCPNPAACPNVVTEFIPDEDPLDGQGHGTHVAGIAAGNAVEADDIAPGMAPKADIVGIKVCTPLGSCHQILEGIEWAINHNLYLDDPDSDMVPGFRPEGKIDIINMSLGDSFGSGTLTYDAVLGRAIEAGITVIAAAGNSGNTVYIVGYPNSYPEVLSVANSFPPGETSVAVKSDWMDAMDMEQTRTDPATEGVEDWLPQLADTGNVTGQLAYYGLACNDENGDRTPPEQEINEKVALILRGDCAFYDKLKNAQAEGAIGAIVFTQTAGNVVRMACAAPSDCSDGPGFPGVMIDLPVGEALRDLVLGGTVVNVDIGSILANFLTDTVNNSSSRGPGRKSAHIKPQITAPGTNINAAQNGTGNGMVKLSGTSMASPTVAGIAALLVERANADGLELSAVDVAAMSMNYSTPAIYYTSNETGPRAGVTRQGAGLVQAYDSVTRSTLVRSEAGIAELSYGNVHVSDSDSRFEQTINVRNLSDETKHYALDWSFAFPEEDGDQGVTIEADPASVTVEAGGSADVTVSLVVDGSALRPWFPMENNPLVLPRMQTHEVDGFVSLTETNDAGDAIDGGDVVGLPFFTLPRPAGCTVMDSSEHFSLAAGETMDTSWSNECAGMAELMTFWNLGTDPQEDDMPDKIDVAQVGVRYGTITDPGGTDIDVLEFAIANVGSHRWMYEVDPYLYIDLDQDGNWDKVIFWGLVSATQFMNITDNAPANNGIGPGDPTGNAWNAAGGLINYHPDQNVMILTTHLTSLDPDLSFEDGDVSFNFALDYYDAIVDYKEEEGGGLAGLLGDAAPDDKADGGHYVFDQAVLDCFSITDEFGSELAFPALSIEMDAEAGNLPATISRVCDEMGEVSEDFGILSVYAGNTPGEGSWEVRGYGAPPTFENYLPWLGHDYERPMPEGDGDMP